VIRYQNTTVTLYGMVHGREQIEPGVKLTSPRAHSKMLSHVSGSQSEIQDGESWTRSACLWSLVDMIESKFQMQILCFRRRKNAMTHMRVSRCRKSKMVDFLNRIWDTCSYDSPFWISTMSQWVIHPTWYWASGWRSQEAASRWRTAKPRVICYPNYISSPISITYLTYLRVWGLVEVRVG